jgi:hypothetical protein
MPPISWIHPQYAVTIKAAVALAGLALLILRWYGARQQLPPSRSQEVRLALLGVLGFVAWFNFGAFGIGRGYFHYYEFFHYYIGAKYSSELGYTGIYACVGAAEIDEGRRKEVYSRWMRDLRNNEIQLGSTFALEYDRCRSEFTSPERWKEFKHDVEFFRTRMSPGAWLEALADHGYNPSPVWTVVGKALTSTGPAAPTQMALLWWLDPVLLVGMFAAVYWAFGWRVLAVALIFWGTNHLSRYFFIGGAFLRQDWLFLAVLGICLAKRGHMLASGAALTWSALIRIFPGIIVLGLILKIVADSWQARRFCLTAAHVQFAGGALLALAVWLPLSLTARGTDGRPLAAWTEFISNTRKMATTSSVNQVGLPVVLAFDPAMRSERVVRFWVDTPWDVWREGRQRTLHDRRFLQLALVAGFLVLLALAVRGCDDWVALTLGVAAIPMLLELSNYYYGILMAFAFLWPLRPLAGVSLAATALLSNLVLGLWTAEDDRYTAISVVVVLLVVCVAIAFAWHSWLSATDTAPTNSGADRSETYARPA